MKRFYEVSVYTGEKLGRRLYFPDLDSAMAWAMQEESEGDYTEIWLTTVSTERTSSWGSLMIEENERIF